MHDFVQGNEFSNESVVTQHKIRLDIQIFQIENQRKSIVEEMLVLSQVVCPCWKIHVKASIREIKETIGQNIKRHVKVNGLSVNLIKGRTL